MYTKPTPPFVPLEEESLFGRAVEKGFLKTYCIVFNKSILDASLFAQDQLGVVRVYYGNGSLYLLSNEELATKLGIKKINSLNLIGRSHEKLLQLPFSQVAVKSQADIEEYYADKAAFAQNIIQYAAASSKAASATSSNTRYFMNLVGETFAGNAGRGIYCTYTKQGALFTAAKIGTTRSTFIRQLKMLSEKGLIIYDEVATGEALIKFNRGALNYDRDLAPYFFEALTY